MNDSGPAASDVRSLLILRGLPRVGDRTLLALVERFGSARQALDAPEDAFVEVAGRDAALARRDPEVRAEVQQALDRAREMGAGVVGLDSAGYPPVLRQLHDPPPVLFLRGDRALLDRPSVAVVGSRKATAYGRRTAELIGGALARAGLPVVSGLALGIDAAAHRGALAAGGRAIGVLGSGVDVPHPRTNAGLFRILGRDHLLVSEFLPGQPPLPHHFPQRNRILAALSEAVVVVEAAEKSGALITVDHAMDLGREVIAVPGRVDSATSRGTNALIRDGAAAVVDPRGIAEMLPAVAPSGRSTGAAAGGKRGPEPRGDGGRLWEALEPGPRRVDDLARELGLEPAKILSLLSSLEVAGWAESLPGMRYARRDGSSGT